MTKATEKADRSTRAMCDRIATVVIDMFVDELLVEAKDSGKRGLDAQRVTELARTFKQSGKDAYLMRVRKIAEAWVTEIERDHWNQARKRPFERVMVQRFSHLFPPAESLDHAGTVSRRALPGLLHVFEMMAGAEFLGQCQAAGRAIFKGVKEEHGGTLSWDDFYKDPRANDLVDDLLAIVAWGFRNPAERLEWMRTTINAHLAPPEDYTFEGDAVDTWTLGREGQMEMLRGLFQDFRRKLASPEGRREVERRYGQRAHAAIEALLAFLFAER